MEKIKLMTDSASDIPQELLKELGIEMVSFPIQVGEEEYLDRATVSPEEFYEILEEEEDIPTHAQITPYQFGELFFKAWKDGYTHAIFVAINSLGSATYHNAKQEAKAFFFENPAAKGKIEINVIDSRTYSLGYGTAVVEAARMAKAGKACKEIVAYLNDWMKFSKVLFVPFSLKYAKKSGRVSASTAFLGEALGMKPIMTFEKGDSVVLGKVRGEKNVVSALLDMAKEDFQAGAPYAILRSTMEDYEEDLIDEATDLFEAEPSLISYAGGTIAINAGTEFIGIGYRKKDPKNPTENWKWNYVDPDEVQRKKDEKAAKLQAEEDARLAKEAEEKAAKAKEAAENRSKERGKPRPRIT